MSDAAESLFKALDGLAAVHKEAAISASRPVNDLLEVWQLAAAIDGSVAAPVEALLTALVGRQLTTADELLATADEVRAAAGRVLQDTSA